MKQIKNNYSQGQAMVTVLYVVVIGILVTTGAVFVLMSNSSVASIETRGLLARSAAESGAENALLKLIRDPSYSGETMQIDQNRSATVTVTGTSPQTITSIGTMGSLVRRIQITLEYNDGIRTILSWNDLP